MYEILGFFIVALLMGTPLWLALLVYLFGEWRRNQ
jgi:hypothetical protein